MGRTEWTGNTTRKELEVARAGSAAMNKLLDATRLKLLYSLFGVNIKRLGQITRPVDSSHSYCQPHPSDISKHELALRSDTARKKVVLANCTASTILPGCSTINFMQPLQRNWLLPPIKNPFWTTTKKAANKTPNQTTINKHQSCKEIQRQKSLLTWSYSCLVLPLTIKLSEIQVSKTKEVFRVHTHAY